ncbi:hypothetical protein [Photorhabdus khanii]|uniref:Uncharacterized protein n=1 Tax=Photorhabdus khanii subsp. guanajuatensis TaxID=2100166 RepID=A0A4V6P8E9_9GAMM|nr:hypothetical protein [Photorhabdus khanii]TDB56905.1 hypothetical protein C5467_12325 [Photorhabdus khanii subsp. guanajuatensis]
MKNPSILKINERVSGIIKDYTFPVTIGDGEIYVSFTLVDKENNYYHFILDGVTTSSKELTGLLTILGTAINYALQVSVDFVRVSKNGDYNITSKITCNPPDKDYRNHETKSES